jgi:hypothetical protein
MEHWTASRTDVPFILAIPQVGCDNPGPGMDRRLLKYHYSKQTSTALRYYLSEYDFFRGYKTL